MECNCEIVSLTKGTRHRDNPSVTTTTAGPANTATPEIYETTTITLTDSKSIITKVKQDEEEPEVMRVEGNRVEKENGVSKQKTE